MLVSQNSAKELFKSQYWNLKYPCIIELASNYLQIIFVHLDLVKITQYLGLFGSIGQ